MQHKVKIREFIDPIPNIIKVGELEYDIEVKEGPQTVIYHRGDFVVMHNNIPKYTRRRNFLKRYKSLIPAEIVQERIELEENKCQI